MIYLLIYTFGLKYLEATATLKIPWIINVAISTLVFWLNGLIDIKVGLILIAGTTLGGYIGARVAIKKGDKFIKMAVSIFVILSIIKLLI